MPRIKLTVSQSMERALKLYSDETDVPVSALIREAIVEWAQKRGIDLKNGVSWGGVRYPELPQREDEELGEEVAEFAR